jgi:dUTP pyrophosphatase
MKLRIRRLLPDVPLPAYHSPGAAAFDLSVAEDATLAPGEVRLVRTGLVLELPPGHFLAIVARSSLPLRKGLIVANGVGIVDADYSGPADEVKIELLNPTSAAVTVTKGERLAQALVLACVRVELEEITKSTSPSRGGFGATGGYAGG